MLGHTALQGLLSSLMLAYTNKVVVIYTTVVKKQMEQMTAKSS